MFFRRCEVSEGENLTITCHIQVHSISDSVAVESDSSKDSVFDINLSLNLWKMKLQNELIDAVIKVDDCSEVIPVHKAVLCAKSDEFQSMFANFKALKSGENKVVCTQFGLDAMEKLVEYIYIGKLDSRREDMKEGVFDLCFAADYYNVQGLKYQCFSLMSDLLNGENVFKILETAWTLGCESLVEKCFGVLEENKERMESQVCKLLCLKIPELGFHLLQRVLSKNASISYDQEEIRDRNTLVGSFWIFYLDNILTDVKLKGKDGILHCHKVILYSSCPALKEMINNSRENEIDVSNFSLKSLQSFVEHLYTSDVDVDLANATELLEIADFFEDKQLKMKCIKVLSNSINAKNIEAILFTAWKFKSALLTRVAILFLVDNPEIRTLQSFKDLHSKNQEFCLYMMEAWASAINSGKNLKTTQLYEKHV